MLNTVNYWSLVTFFDQATRKSQLNCATIFLVLLSFYLNMQQEQFERQNSEPMVEMRELTPGNTLARLESILQESTPPQYREIN